MTSADILAAVRAVVRECIGRQVGDEARRGVLAF